MSICLSYWLYYCRICIIFYSYIGKITNYNSYTFFGTERVRQYLSRHLFETPLFRSIRSLLLAMKIIRIQMRNLALPYCYSRKSTTVSSGSAVCNHNYYGRSLSVSFCKKDNFVTCHKISENYRT